MLSLLIPALCLFSFTRANIPSPAANADLICHTTNPAECYPREFVPTNEFQKFHDDQSIPKGLHIRLNLATGVKEAKINVPDLDESEQQYSDHTVEVPVPEAKEGQRSDLIIVEEPEEEPSPPNIHDQSIPEHQYPIRPPPFHPGEHSLFSDSITILKSSSPESDPRAEVATRVALSDLEDLAHSYHWGVTLTQDRATSHKIFQLLSASTPSSEIRSAATLLLGTAIHNNPEALTAALTHFYNDEWPNGPLEAVLVGLVHENLPKLLQRMMFLLSGLCQNPIQLSKFVDAGGLDTLLRIFNDDVVNKNHDGKLQGKIANFVLDHFLQTDDVMSPLLNEKLDEIKLPRKGDANREVASKLEGEDSWVLANEEKQLDHLSKDTNIRNGKNMAAALQAWCPAFKNRIRASKNSGSTNIEEAWDALDRTLEANGCSCDEPCSSSA